MSNKPGAGSILSSIPRIICPHLSDVTATLKSLFRGEQPKDKSSPPTGKHHLYFHERLHGEVTEVKSNLDGTVPHSVPAEMNLTFVLDDVEKFKQDRTFRILGNVLIGSNNSQTRLSSTTCSNYHIVDGQAILHPFDGYFTSSIFFQYRLILKRTNFNPNIQDITKPHDDFNQDSMYLPLDNHVYVLYGEKIVQSGMNPLRLWKNVSTLHINIFQIPQKQTIITGNDDRRYEGTLNIHPLQYPMDQIFGIQTSTYMTTLVWLWYLLYYVIRTHFNTNTRELTNYWATSSGKYNYWKHSFLNWDGGIKYPMPPNQYKIPNDFRELKTIVAQAYKNNANIRMVGSGHSFNQYILETNINTNHTSIMLDIRNLNSILEINLATNTVIVEGGVQLRRLAEVLHDHGLTLPNHGAYLVQTISGALSTGTHGTSGDWKYDSNDIKTGTQPLINCVLGAKLLTEDGKIVELNCNQITTLGLAGVLYQITLQVEPINYLRINQNWLHRNEIVMNINSYLSNYPFVEIRGPTGSTNASLYTYSKIPTVPRMLTLQNLIIRYILVLVYESAAFRMPAFLYRFTYGLLTRACSIFPLQDVNTWCITKDYAPPHLETEWSIPHEYTPIVLQKVLFPILDQKQYSSLVGEWHIRFDLSTQAWAAPSYNRKNTYIDINFPRANNMKLVNQLYIEFQYKLLEFGKKHKFDVRPHWSKVSTPDPMLLQALTNNSGNAQFKQFIQQISPQGIFSHNPFSHRYELVEEKKERSLNVKVTRYPFITTGESHPIELMLTRYSSISDTPSSQAYPLLCISGLNSSSRMFSLTSIGNKTLVEHMVSCGFDVWTLDWRCSPDLPLLHGLQYDFDTVAAIDFPQAVNHVLRLTKSTKLHIFVHCMACPTFFMSMLSGAIKPTTIASAICHQVGMNFNASAFNYKKASDHVATILSAVRVNELSITSSDTFLDRAFALTSYLTCKATLEKKEQCTLDDCHRLTFCYSLLFDHANLNASTHSMVSQIIGDATMTAFKQIEKFILHGHVVNYKGDNVYVEAGQQHQYSQLAFPILFVANQHNRVWDPSSVDVTRALLSSYNKPSLYHVHKFSNMGHLDSLIGVKAAELCYPIFSNYFIKQNTNQ